MSHKNVERACDDFFESPPAQPSMPVCSHSGLFPEKGDFKVCRRLPLDSQYFGEPEKPASCN